MKFKLFILAIVLFGFGCKQNYTPKPNGFYRIEFPKKTYHLLDSIFPYQFAIPDYAVIKPDERNPDEPYWINISIPENKAEIHISYYDIKKANKKNPYILGEFMEETRNLAYKHSIKANAINEKIYQNPNSKIFGVIYEIKGNAASPMQFFITDSVQHFLRGALYIREVPNIDSLKPVIDFLEPDIINIIETASWK